LVSGLVPNRSGALIVPSGADAAMRASAFSRRALCPASSAIVKRVNSSRTRVRQNRGAAGYGLGLEGTTHARIEQNAFVDNHVGLWISDAAAADNNRVQHNAFAFNGAGFEDLLPIFRFAR
jgi:nitrous oxidase accessory protein NosD